MREIKFRAWNKFFNEMYYFDLKENIEIGIGGLWVKHKEGSVCINQSSICVMQYTGLKDKNCKEIYQGDIVHITDDCYDINNIFKVSWEQGIGSYVFNNIDDMKRHKYDSFEYIFCFCHLNCIKHCEVIGNVYENPELLERYRTE